MWRVAMIRPNRYFNSRMMPLHIQLISPMFSSPHFPLSCNYNMHFRNKLMDMEVDTPLITWITDYLTGQPHYVRLKSCCSDSIVSTGAPQGIVLFPFLFTSILQTSRYRSESCHLQRFPDDSAIVG